MVSSLVELASSRELLANLTLREVRGKYKRTVLGQGWSLINPVATMLIYTMVFGFLLRVELEPGNPSGLDIFALWLMCGLLPWAFLANTVTSGLVSLVSNANLVNKVYFPREILVAATVLSWDVTFCIEMGVLALVLLLFGAFVLPWLPLVLVFMALLTMFGLGLALLLSIANVYFRDSQHFVGILLQLWFFLTPIVYPLSYVEEQEARLAADGNDLPLVAIYKLNPMEHFVSAFRSLLYDNRLPTAEDTVWCIAAAMASLAIGYVVFQRYEGRIAEEL